MTRMDTGTQDPQELPSTRAEAKRLGHRQYFTGKPCKNGHIDVRNTKNGTCFTCANECNRRYYQNNPDKVNEQARRWRHANPERVREHNRRWYYANPEWAREVSRRYRKANPEKRREVSRRWSRVNREYVRERSLRWYYANHKHALERGRKYRQNHPEKVLEIDRRHHRNNPERRALYNASRRAAKLQRTPKWVDYESIRSVYAEACRLTEETGIKHHVDHIYPLRGDTVSGLHVAENLEPVPAHVNLSKANKNPDEED